MSGGTFDYKQSEILRIAEEIDAYVRNNRLEVVSEYGTPYTYDLRDDTIEQFKIAAILLKRAFVYAQRIDWLMAGDDGEDTFHERLREELAALEHNDEVL